MTGMPEFPGAYLRFKPQPALPPGASHQIRCICPLISKTAFVFSQFQCVPFKDYFRWDVCIFQGAVSHFLFQVLPQNFIYVQNVSSSFTGLDLTWTSCSFLVPSCSFLELHLKSPRTKTCSYTGSLSSLAEGGKR